MVKKNFSVNNKTWFKNSLYRTLPYKKSRASALFLLGTVLTLILLILPTSNAQAKQNSDATEERWYKVEICIFANDSTNAELSEHWPENIKTAYPQNIRYLFSPVTISNSTNSPLSTNDNSNALASGKTDFSSLSIHDNKNSRYIDIDLYPNNEAAAETNSTEIGDELINPMPHELGNKSYGTRSPDDHLLQKQIDTVYLDPLTTDPFTDKPIDETASQASEPEAMEQAELDSQTSSTSEPIAFALLDDQQQDLHQAIGKIKQSQYLRVLLHKAWLQPINNKKDAIHLALRGGNKYDKHHELEGSIYLYRQRYLHLDTNLWLSKLAPNIGQADDTWPMLPPYPFILQESSTEEFAQHNNSNGNEFTLDLTEQASNDWPNGKDLADQYNALLNNKYVTERIVLMNQHRKMRSKELHYIDHPLFGLLIQITPYEPPEVEELKDS